MAGAHVELQDQTVALPGPPGVDADSRNESMAAALIGDRECGHLLPDGVQNIRWLDACTLSAVGVCPTGVYLEHNSGNSFDTAPICGENRQQASSFIARDVIGTQFQKLFGIRVKVFGFRDT